jgi:type VI secretion system protein ImpE
MPEPPVDATQHFKDGRLREALDAQILAVKAAPADHGKRLFLFELSAFAGDLDRARRQIDALSYDDPELEQGRVTYLKLLDAEDLRRKLFRDGVQPSFAADPPEHVAYRLDAIRLLREGRTAEAAEVLDQANAMAPPLSGSLNGKPFDGIRDADDLLGPVLEVMAQGKYLWLPLEQVTAVAMGPPRFPRDTIWAPARVVTTVGEEGEVFLPTLYAGSHEHADDAIRLGRATSWTEDAPVRGCGAKTFLVGDDGVGLLEWRELMIGSDSPAG